MNVKLMMMIKSTHHVLPTCYIQQQQDWCGTCTLTWTCPHVHLEIPICEIWNEITHCIRVTVQRRLVSVVATYIYGQQTVELGERSDVVFERDVLRTRTRRDWIGMINDLITHVHLENNKRTIGESCSFQMREPRRNKMGFVLITIQFTEPTITWVPSGFSGYIWLDTKIVLKNKQKNTIIIRVRRQNSTTAEELARIQHLFSNPSWLTLGRPSGHQNLVSIFSGIDNCLKSKC